MQANLQDREHQGGDGGSLVSFTYIRMTKDRTMEDSISSVDSGTAVSLGMAEQCLVSFFEEKKIIKFSQKLMF